MSNLLLSSVQVDEERIDVRIRGGRILEWGSALSRESDEETIQGDGGALLPGIRDHHLHLMALAAARRSLQCGPPHVRDAAELRDLLSRAAADASRSGRGSNWLRGVGYHESVADSLDRRTLDRFLEEVPLRVQHRSGALWILNSAGVKKLGIDRRGDWPDGVECDESGVPNGRLYRLDGWLRERLQDREAPCLSEVGLALSKLGVTGVTDATPGNNSEALAIFRDAVDSRQLPQRLLVMGGMDLPRTQHPRIKRGALKVMLDENALPDEAHLVESIRRAHGDGRGVAFHCVTRAELLVAATALQTAGPRDGDRIEHASLAPPDLLEYLSEIPLTIVTQPNFLRERGDAYLAQVEARDQPWLYRGRAFLEAGLPLGAGTDAPFGDCDPWAAMRAAVDRRSAQGIALGREEALSPEQALALFTSPLESPGQALPVLAPGQPADLILLDRPWEQARSRLDANDVRMTLIDGHQVWQRR